MERIVKFNDGSAAASGVAQHLYHVVQDSNKLIFSEFDEIAFKAAVAWEGLTSDDYDYVSNNVIPPAHTGVRFVAFGRPRITLDFTLEARANHYHALSLNVLPDITVMSSDGYDEFPLAIDPQLLYLIGLLRRTMRHDSVEQEQVFASITTNLESARFQIPNCRTFHNAFVCCNLVLHGSGQSQQRALNLSDVSLSVNRSILE